MGVTHVSLLKGFVVGGHVPKVDESVVASRREHVAPGAESQRRGNARAARGLDLGHVRGVLPNVEHPKGAVDGGEDAQPLGREGLALEAVAGEALGPGLYDAKLMRAAAIGVFCCCCRHSDQLNLNVYFLDFREDRLRVSKKI